jgi:hypothetical protein
MQMDVIEEKDYEADPKEEFERKEKNYKKELEKAEDEFTDLLIETQKKEKILDELKIKL